MVKPHTYAYFKPMNKETENALWSQEAYQECLLFVAERHKEQQVPGTELPYLVHLSNVCMEVMAALPHSTGIDGTMAILTALLHDCIEDTDTAPEEIAERFGEEVLRNVQALSKDGSLPKEERMPDSLRRIQEAGAVAAMVKLADRITNLQEPPAFWSQEKRKAYQQQAEKILEALGSFHPWLAERLRMKIDAYGQWC